MSTPYPAASTPQPSVHAQQSSRTPKTLPPNIFLGLIEELFGALAVALGGINIGGFQPLAFLQQWGRNLEAQGAAAIAGAQTAQTTAAAAIAVQSQQSIAKPVSLAVDPSADAVFHIATITGSTPSMVSLSSGASLMGFIPTPDNGKKFSVIWLGQNTTGLTGFFINLYKMDTATGVITLHEGSTNLISSVSNSLAWNYYDLVTPFTTSVGDVYAAEAVVTGSGTYQLAGLPNHWLPANTAVNPQQMAATRAPLAVTYDATGPGLTATPGTTSTSGSTTHTATAGAAVIVELAVYMTTPGSNTATRTVTYGGVPMTSFGYAYYNNFGDGWVELFGITNVPGGAQTVAYSVTGAPFSIKTVELNSVSYNSVRGFGTPVTSYGSGTSLTTGSVSAALADMVVTAFGMISGAASPIGSFSGTSRKTDAVNNGTYYAQSNMGDAPGNTTVTITATSSASNHWAAVSVPLLPSLEPAPNTPTYTYTGNVPWFGLGGSLFAGPTVTNYPTAGTYTYTVPNWMKWGDNFDIAPVGAGGGGQSAFGWAVGKGGYAGSWNPVTLVYGVDIPLTTTSFTVTVGSGGLGGIGGTIGQPGFAGGDTTITGAGLTTVTAAGGLGGNGGTNGAGIGPGPITFNGVTYPGGGNVGLGVHGAAPGGGGGAGGVWGNGANGADGAVTITAYQAGTTP